MHIPVRSRRTAMLIGGLNVALVLFGSWCSLAQTQTGGVRLVANADVATDTLTKSDVENIFLGRKTTWDDGKGIKVATLKAGSAHDIFLEKYLRKTASQFKSFWKRLAFTGEGIPPKTFKTEADLVKYVTRTKGAVGYISAKTVHNGLKVLKAPETE